MSKLSPKQQEFGFTKDYRRIDLVGAIKHMAKIRKRWYGKQRAEEEGTKQWQSKSKKQIPVRESGRG